MLFVALIAGLFLRGITPAGYMFDLPQDGSGVVIKICSGLETRYAVLDPETGNVSEIDLNQTSNEDHELTVQDPCPFGILSLIDLPSVQDIALPLPQAPPVLRAPQVQLPYSSLAKTDHAPRAPPTSHPSTHIIL